MKMDKYLKSAETVKPGNSRVTNPAAGKKIL